MKAPTLLGFLLDGCGAFPFSWRPPCAAVACAASEAPAGSAPPALLTPASPADSSPPSPRRRVSEARC